MAKMGCYAGVKITREQWLQLTAEVMQNIMKYEELFVIIGHEDEEKSDSDGGYFFSVESDGGGVLDVVTVDEYVDFGNHNVNMFGLVGDSTDEGVEQDISFNHRTPEETIRELIIAICGKARGPDNPISTEEVKDVNRLLTEFVDLSF